MESRRQQKEPSVIQTRGRTTVKVSSQDQKDGRSPLHSRNNSPGDASKARNSSATKIKDSTSGSPIGDRTRLTRGKSKSPVSGRNKIRECVSPVCRDRVLLLRCSTSPCLPDGERITITRSYTESRVQRKPSAADSGDQLQTKRDSSPARNRVRSMKRNTDTAPMDNVKTTGSPPNGATVHEPSDSAAKVSSSDTNRKSRSIVRTAKPSVSLNVSPSKTITTRRKTADDMDDDSNSSVTDSQRNTRASSDNEESKTSLRCYFGISNTELKNLFQDDNTAILPESPTYYSDKRRRSRRSNTRTAQLDKSQPGAAALKSPSATALKSLSSKTSCTTEVKLLGAGVPTPKNSVSETEVTSPAQISESIAMTAVSSLGQDNASDLPARMSPIVRLRKLCQLTVDELKTGSVTELEVPSSSSQEVTQASQALSGESHETDSVPTKRDTGGEHVDDTSGTLDNKCDVAGMGRKEEVFPQDVNMETSPAAAANGTCDEITESDYLNTTKKSVDSKLKPSSLSISLSNLIAKVTDRVKNVDDEPDLESENEDDEEDDDEEEEFSDDSSESMNKEDLNQDVLETESESNDASLPGGSTREQNQDDNQVKNCAEKAELSDCSGPEASLQFSLSGLIEKMSERMECEKRASEPGSGESMMLVGSEMSKEADSVSKSFRKDDLDGYVNEDNPIRSVGGYKSDDDDDAAKQKEQQSPLVIKLAAVEDSKSASDQNVSANDQNVSANDQNVSTNDQNVSTNDQNVSKRNDALLEDSADLDDSADPEDSTDLAPEDKVRELIMSRRRLSGSKSFASLAKEKSKPDDDFTMFKTFERHEDVDLTKSAFESNALDLCLAEMKILRNETETVQWADREYDINQIDGSLFKSFDSRDYLEDYVRVVEAEEDGESLRAPSSPTKRKFVDGLSSLKQKQFQYGIAGNVSRYFKKRGGVKVGMKKVRHYLQKSDECEVSPCSPQRLVTPTSPVKSPSKTNDITKIKGWKEKFSQEDAELVHSAPHVERDGLDDSSHTGVDGPDHGKPSNVISMSPDTESDTSPSSDNVPLRILLTQNVQNLGLHLKTQLGGIRSRWRANIPAPRGRPTLQLIKKNNVASFEADDNQPSKGWIYGRRIDGKFATKKAVIKIKKKGRKPIRRLDASWNPNLSYLKKRQIRNVKDKMMFQPVMITRKMVIDALEALDPFFLHTSTPDRSNVPDNIASCQRPGCRYGCACKRTDTSSLPQYIEDFVPPLEDLNEDELPPLPQVSGSLPECGHVYCRLGAVCDSIKMSDSKEMTRKDHCGRIDCMISCDCLRRAEPLGRVLRSHLWQGESSEPNSRSTSPVTLEQYLAKKLKDPPNKPTQIENDKGKSQDQQTVGKHELEELPESGTKPYQKKAQHPSNRKLVTGEVRKCSRLKGHRSLAHLDMNKHISFYDTSLWLSPKSKSFKHSNKKYHKTMSGSSDYDLPPEVAAKNVVRTHKEPATFITTKAAARQYPIKKSQKQMSPVNATLDDELKRKFQMELDLDLDESDGEETMGCARSTVYVPARLQSRQALNSNKDERPVIPVAADIRPSNHAIPKCHSLPVITSVKSIKLESLDDDTGICHSVHDQQSVEHSHSPKQVEGNITQRQTECNVVNKQSSSATVARPATVPKKTNVQMVMLQKKSKGKDKTLVLLEIKSDCDWSKIRASILSKISSALSKMADSSGHSDIEVENFVVSYSKSQTTVAVPIPRHMQNPLISPAITEMIPIRYFITVRETIPDDEPVMPDTDICLLPSKINKQGRSVEEECSVLTSYPTILKKYGQRYQQWQQQQHIQLEQPNENDTEKENLLQKISIKMRNEKPKGDDTDQHYPDTGVSSFNHFKISTGAMIKSGSGSLVVPTNPEVPKYRGESSVIQQRLLQFRPIDNAGQRLKLNQQPFQVDQVVVSKQLSSGRSEQNTKRAQLDSVVRKVARKSTSKAAVAMAIQAAVDKRMNDEDALMADKTPASVMNHALAVIVPEEAGQTLDNEVAKITANSLQYNLTSPTSVIGTQDGTHDEYDEGSAHNCPATATATVHGAAQAMEENAPPIGSGNRLARKSTTKAAAAMAVREAKRRLSDDQSIGSNKRSRVDNNSPIVLDDEDDSMDNLHTSGSTFILTKNGKFYAVSDKLKQQIEKTGQVSTKLSDPAASGVVTPPTVCAVTDIPPDEIQLITAGVETSGLANQAAVHAPNVGNVIKEPDIQESAIDKSITNSPGSNRSPSKTPILVAMSSLAEAQSVLGSTAVDDGGIKRLIPSANRFKEQLRMAHADNKHTVISIQDGKEGKSKLVTYRDGIWQVVAGELDSRSISPNPPTLYEANSLMARSSRSTSEGSTVDMPILIPEDGDAVDKGRLSVSPAMSPPVLEPQLITTSSSTTAPTCLTVQAPATSSMASTRISPAKIANIATVNSPSVATIPMLPKGQKNIIPMKLVPTSTKPGSKLMSAVPTSTTLPLVKAPVQVAGPNPLVVRPTVVTAPIQVAGDPKVSPLVVRPPVGKLPTVSGATSQPPVFAIVGGLPIVRPGTTPIRPALIPIHLPGSKAVFVMPVMPAAIGNQPTSVAGLRLAAPVLPTGLVQNVATPPTAVAGMTLMATPCKSPMMCTDVTATRTGDSQTARQPEIIEIPNSPESGENMPSITTGSCLAFSESSECGVNYLHSSSSGEAAAQNTDTDLLQPVINSSIRIGGQYFSRQNQSSSDVLPVTSSEQYNVESQCDSSQGPPPVGDTSSQTIPFDPDSLLNPIVTMETQPPAEDLNFTNDPFTLGQIAEVDTFSALAQGSESTTELVEPVVIAPITSPCELTGLSTPETDMVVNNVETSPCEQPMVPLPQSLTDMVSHHLQAVSDEDPSITQAQETSVTNLTNMASHASGIIDEINQEQHGECDTEENVFRVSRGSAIQPITVSECGSLSSIADISEYNSQGSTDIGVQDFVSQQSECSSADLALMSSMDYLKEEFMDDFDEVDIIGDDTDEDDDVTAAWKLRSQVDSPRSEARHSTMSDRRHINKKKRKQLYNDRMIDDNLPSFENPQFEETVPEYVDPYRPTTPEMIEDCDGEKSDFKCRRERRRRHDMTYKFQMLQEMLYPNSDKMAKQFVLDAAVRTISNLKAEQNNLNKLQRQLTKRRDFLASSLRSLKACQKNKYTAITVNEETGVTEHIKAEFTMDDLEIPEISPIKKRKLDSSTYAPSRAELEQAKQRARPGPRMFSKRKPFTEPKPNPVTSSLTASQLLFANMKKSKIDVEKRYSISQSLSVFKKNKDQAKAHAVELGSMAKDAARSMLEQALHKAKAPKTSMMYPLARPRKQSVGSRRSPVVEPEPTIVKDESESSEDSDSCQISETVRTDLLPKRKLCMTALSGDDDLDNIEKQVICIGNKGGKREKIDNEPKITVISPKGMSPAQVALVSEKTNHTDTNSSPTSANKLKTVRIEFAKFDKGGTVSSVDVKPTVVSSASEKNSLPTKSVGKKLACQNELILTKCDRCGEGVAFSSKMTYDAICPSCGHLIHKYTSNGTESPTHSATSNEQQVAACDGPGTVLTSSDIREVLLDDSDQESSMVENILMGIEPLEDSDDLEIIEEAIGPSNMSEIT